ncbi:RidA family protein [Alkalicoccobacillus porphyridii]|uniref:RidA family protein n=1 Tax=Alkalicoccobacillus porphyridii TaxID=2597270 RepID=UPI0021B0C4CA|nr:RidA family protein [Alkalicoccobacillus porphyridii]
MSQAYSSDGIVYISGQFSRDMQGNFVGEHDIELQTKQTFDNLDRVLTGFNIKRSNLVDLEIFLINPQEDSETLIPIFKQYMGDIRPAVTMVGTAGLAFSQMLIEIRAIAHVD